MQHAHLDRRALREGRPDGRRGEDAAEAGGQGGTGLRGTIYDNADFTGDSVTKVMDADEFYGQAQPDPAIGADDFTITLQGEVQAELPPW